MSAIIRQPMLRQLVPKSDAPQGDQSSGLRMISPQKLEANRENAQKSTGPKTTAGKQRSRWNATKHGLLARSTVILEGKGKEEKREFDRVLAELRKDRQPVGFLEEMLVEQMANCYWRLGRAARCEVTEIRELMDIIGEATLPSKEATDKILRYETALRRQLHRDINQLERLQRQRKGENVPPPKSSV